MVDVKVIDKLKNNAEINSIKKYCDEIFFLQKRHLNFKIKNEIKGILSNQLIFFLQRGQKDLSETISKFLGNR